MAESKGDDKAGRSERVRRALPKSKKLNNTQSMTDLAGGNANVDPASVVCPTPQQPGYTQMTHLPFC